MAAVKRKKPRRGERKGSRGDVIYEKDWIIGACFGKGFTYVQKDHDFSSTSAAVEFVGERHAAATWRTGGGLIIFYLWRKWLLLHLLYRLLILLESQDR